jgi:cephalosporin-C deacetylase-like acetyl esterase
MAPTSHPKLAGLDLIQATYKEVNDHKIRTDILIPQKPYTGKRPVIIRFHGGGLVIPLSPRTARDQQSLPTPGNRRLPLHGLLVALAIRPRN